jgi:PAS domain S-box-containing protein
MPDTPAPARGTRAEGPRPSAEELRRRFEAILHGAGEAILSLDTEGRVLHANAAAAALLGRDAEAMTGRPHHPLLHHTRADGRPYPADACSLRDTLKDAQVRSADEVFWRGDGSSVPVELVAGPLWENGRLTGTVVVFRDVSERRRAEARALQVAREQAARAEAEAARRALQKSEEWLHIALQAGRLGAWEWDVGSGQVSWSPTLERIHGIPEGSFGGTFEAYISDIHPEDRERVIASIRRVVEDREPHDLEYRIVTPAGGVRWLEAHGRLLLDEDGRPARLVGVCQDVTARKEAERALVFQKALLQAQQEALPGGLLLVSAEGRILSYNRTFVEMWRLGEDVLGAGSDAAALRVAVQQVKDPDAFLARVRELYAAGAKGALSAHDVIPMRDGRVIERFSRLVRDDDGSYLGYLWFFREMGEAGGRSGPQ